MWVSGPAGMTSEEEAPPRPTLRRHTGQGAAAPRCPLATRAAARTRPHEPQLSAVVPVSVKPKAGTQ